MTTKTNVQKKPKKKSYFFYNFVKITGFPAAIAFRPKVLQMGSIMPKDVTGGAIITANHSSWFDPVFFLSVFWRRHIHAVTTKDLYRSKFSKFFFNHCHCIQVNKENFSMSCFHQVKETLNEDELVLIFPEGQLNTNKEDMLTFKSGAILMAHATNKPIIPMYVYKGKKLFNRFIGVIGDPINVRELCGPFPTLEKINEISELLKAKEEELKEFYLRSKYAKH